MSDLPGSLAEALTRLQADLPHVGKDAAAIIPTKGGGTYGYKYADLPSLTRILMPRLAQLGLIYFCYTERLDGVFGMSYRLVHVSDPSDKIGGFWPIPLGTPQAMGSALTYARRYCLCALTGVAPDEEDDDAQAAEQEYRQLRDAPPEVDGHGAATFAEQERMVTGKVPGAWRATSTAENDQWYDMPPAEPRDYDSPGTITPDQLKALHAKYAVAGIKTRPAQLKQTAAWLNLPGPLESHSHLSQRQGRALLDRLEQETTGAKA